MFFKVSNVFQKLIICITIILSSIIFINSIFVVNDHTFSPSFLVGNMSNVFCVLLLSIILIVGIIIVYNLFNKLNYKQLKISAFIIFGISIFGFVLMLLNFRVVPITDSFVMVDQAKYLSNYPDSIVNLGSYLGYFSKYSNNYLLTILFKYFFVFLKTIGFKDYMLGLYILNALALFSSIFLTFLIAKKTKGIRFAVKVLTLCVLNPVFYFMTFWVYSCTLSIPIMMLIIYLGILFYQTQKISFEIICSVLIGLLSVLAYFLRPTSVIPLIALILCAILFGIKKRTTLIKYLRCAAVTAITCALVFACFSSITNVYFSKISAGNFPITHWTMMSSHGNGNFNGKDEKFTSSFQTKEEKSDETLEKTIDNYSELGIIGTAQLFYNKIVTNWSDGYSECDVRLNQDKNFTPLYQLMVGTNRDYFLFYCEAFRLVTMLLIIISLVFIFKKRDKTQFLYCLIFLGAIVFYLLWEVKSCYSVPFLTVMLLISANGADNVTSEIGDVSQYLTNRGFKIMSACFIAVTIAISVFNFSAYYGKQIQRNDYVVKTFSPQMVTPIVALSEKGNVVTQSFKSSKPFNRISLFTKYNDYDNAQSDKYKISLYNDDYKQLHSQIVNKENINENDIMLLSFNKISPDTKENFILKIQNLSGSGKPISFMHRKAMAVDNYDGFCRVNGQNKRYDLFIQVFNSYKTDYHPLNLCIGFALFNIFLSAALLFIIHRTYYRRKI